MLTGVCRSQEWERGNTRARQHGFVKPHENFHFAHGAELVRRPKTVKLEL